MLLSRGWVTLAVAIDCDHLIEIRGPRYLSPGPLKV